MDYDDLTQAVCYDQAQLGWKHFLQGKMLPEWHEIINKERRELNLPPNLHAVPQMMRALITMSLNIWRARCEFVYGGEPKANLSESNGGYSSSRWST